MTIKNNNIGDKNRKISGKKIMLVTALLSGGVVIRVNNHINNSFGHAPKEVINFDLTLESTDVLIDDNGTFYVGEGTPIDNFNIYDFVTILDESGNVIADKDVTLEWDVKEYFEGTTFGTKGEYLITITATTADGRTGELEYKLVVKEGHVFEEIKEIDDIQVNVDNKKELLDFQEHFRVLNSVTGADAGVQIESTLKDEDLQSVGTTQVIFYTELDGIKFTNSVHISVVDTIAPRIDLADSFDRNGVEWNKSAYSITISDLDKTIGDFSLDEYATAYDASGDYELSWNFDEVMDGQLDKIASHMVTITAIDGSGNETTVDVHVNISTVSIDFKDGITEVAFELYYDAIIDSNIHSVGAFYDIRDSAGNLIIDPNRISWNLTEEMLREIGSYRLTIEVLDENLNEVIGAKYIMASVKDTTAPEAKLVEGAKINFNVEVDQFNSIDNLYMYLDGITNIDDLVNVTDNSGVWGYRFEYNNEILTDSLLRTIGTKNLTLILFDYDNEGNELNISELSDENGVPISIVLNIVDTKKATIIVTDEIINLEVMQNATKDMIEITNYAEINDNSGTFSWDLRVKGSQDSVMDYEDMLGKITDPAGVALELVVTDSSGNKTYRDMILIVTDTESPVFEVRKTEETININPSATEMDRYRNRDSYVSVTDNSSDFDVEWDFDTVVNANVAGVYEVTVTARDAAGNVSELTITFTVVDNEAPSIIVNTKTIEIEANEYTTVGEFEFDINLKDYITVTDNSNGLINTTFDYSNVDFGEIGTYEVIITASDAVGNEAINIIEIKVISGAPKVNVLKDQVIVDTMKIENNVFTGIKIEIKDGKVLIERASATDESEVLSHLTMENLVEFLTISGETIESAIWDLTSLDVKSIGTNDIQLTVTNNFGKTVTETIEFVVIYEYDSLIKVSGDNYIDIEIDTNKTMTPDWFKSEYEVTDYVEYRAGGGQATIIWRTAELNLVDFSTVGTYIITASITDGHTDTDQVSLTLNIIDTTGPELTVTQPNAFEINAQTASNIDINNYASATDNSGQPVSLSWNLSTQVDFTKVGTYVVTIKAIDASGNETTKEITFEVEDTQPPVLAINPGMDTQTIEINSRDASNFNVNSFVTATDNSGVAPELEWNIQDVDFSTVNSYIVEISATDKEGNKSNVVTITFVIEDTIAPSIDIDPSGLEELKVEISTKSESDYSDWLEDYVTVTDNSGETITPSWDITGVDFNTFGTYRVTITAVDSSNNTITQVVSFGVTDTTAPVITIKDDKEITTLEVFDGKLADFTLADFATCSDASTCTIEWDIQNVDFSTVGTYVVTIKAVDIYGNESRAEITIEVQDNTKPEIVITRPDILLSMGKFTSSDFSVYDFATVTDNYDKSVSLTWDIDRVDFDAEGDYTVTITAIDSSGNEAEEKTVKFIVEEINIILEEVSPFEIEVTQSPDVSNILIETYFKATQDNGSAVEGITWDLTNDMLKVYGTHGVTLTITFDGGKQIVMEVTLEVTDTTGPVITEITNTATIELGNLTEYDNLTPTDFVTADDNSGNYILSWNLDNVVNNTVAATYVVTITATDSSGNFTEHSVNIVVEDTTDPVLELNDSFDRNNMIWSKANKELSILAGDKTQAEIDLWELVTANDASTSGLTITWDLTDLDNDSPGETVTITVTDASGNVATETITVILLKPTPILNNFSVDKSYDEVIVDLDVTNLKSSISDLKIILQDKDGNQEQIYTHIDFTLDTVTLNHVFNVESNTEYNVVLEYTYATGANGNVDTIITEEQSVKTLAYSQNDVLGTITDVYTSHTTLNVNYELSNDLGLISAAELVLIDSSNVETKHIMDVTSESGTHQFVSLTPNSEYTVEIRLEYNFNDGSNLQTKVSDTKDIRTLAYSEHDVITDITGITQSPSTISVDYNIADAYGLIITNGITAKIYDASTMNQVGSDIVLTSLNGTVQFVGLNANTQYIVVIETKLDLKDNSPIIIKETGTQTTTESYSFDEIVVNINNVNVDYDDITFDYEVFDPNGLLVGSTNADKLKIYISGQTFELGGLSGTVKLSDHLSDVTSGTSYDVQIHFSYDLKDGKLDQVHDTNLYGFVESTREYNLNQDLTLTSHNLASDTRTIYVDYTLRNLNFIGDMSTMSVIISSLNDSQEILLSDYFSSLGTVPLEGQIIITDINGQPLEVNTEYNISMGIDYDLRDGYSGVQREVLLLETTEIKTQDQEITGYNVISDVTRGYTFLDSSFEITNTSIYSNLLDTFQIALLDSDGNVVPGFDYVSHSVAVGTNSYRFENLTSDSSYTIVYRVENPQYSDGSNGHNQYTDILRRVSTRTYDTNLINVDYTLTQGLTYLHLEDIQILNDNELFENITYNSVIVVITYTTRDGQVVTVERDLGTLTEGDITEAIFTGIQSNTDVSIEFKLEYDLKDGKGIQSGDDEIVRTIDTKTLEYDFTFVIENDEVLITGLTPGFNGTHLEIFEEVEGYTVKDIKADAFYGDNISFTELTIPRTLETIGQNAFRNVSLTTVNLTSVFETIPSITPRVISDKTTVGILVIGDNAFRDNSITSFDFTTTETIGSSAFRNNNLDEVVLSDTVSYVGTEAFVSSNVTKLTTGMLLSNENFGTDTFVGNEITSLTMGNVGIIHTTFGYSKDVFDNTGFSLIFSDTATGDINERAWLYSTSDVKYLAVKIKNVTIGDGIENIGRYAFYQNELTKVVIGNGVKNIDDFAFVRTGITDLTLGDSVERVGWAAFYDNDITTVNFPESLQRVEEEAFEYNGFVDLTLPNSVIYVGDTAFANNNISNLTIGSLLSDENFGLDTFVGNEINDLTIGNSGFRHDSLGYSKDVFDNLGFSLTIANTAIGDIEDRAWLYSTSDIQYLAVKINNVTIGDGIENIGRYAFYQNELTKVVIGNGVKNVDDFAFVRTGITDLTLGNSVERVGWGAFYENDIPTVNFPETLQRVEEEAFEYNEFTNLTLPNSVNYIGDTAFANNKLTNLTIGSLLSDENFGVDTFVGNNISNLTVGNVGFRHDSLGDSKDVFDNRGFSLEFADTAEGTIQDRAWLYSENDGAYLGVKIQNVTIGDGITSIGRYAFYQNEITTVVIGDNVKLIDDYAFVRTNVVSLTLGSGVEEIGVASFYDNNISMIDLPDSLTILGKDSFKYNAIEDIKLTNNLSSVGEEAFAGNGVLKVEIPSLLNSSVFGPNVFVNKELSATNDDVLLDGTMNELILGNVDFKYNTFGSSTNVFAPTGFDLTYTNDATGRIASNAWKVATAYSDRQINKLTISSNITTIGVSSFENNNIGNLSMGSNVEVIEQEAFKNSGITNLTLNDNLETISEGAFENNSIVDLTIPNTVTDLGKSAFKNNQISNLVLSDQIDVFNESVFENNKLSSLIIDSFITRIEANAFKGNILTELTIPNNVTHVGKEAFANNVLADGTKTLTKVTIEDSLTSSVFSEGNVFIGSAINELVLGNVDFKHNTFGDSSNVFASTGFSLTYTDEAVGRIAGNAWKVDSSYSSVIVNNLTIGSGITTIGVNSFENNNIGTLSMGSNVNTIEMEAFKNAGVSTVTFNSTLELILDGAFENNSITDLTVPNSVTTLGKLAFKDNQISSLVLTNNISVLNESVFENNNLSTFVIETNVLRIEDKAFRGNELTELVIPDNVTYVGEESFANNELVDGTKTLTKLTISDGIEATAFTAGNSFIGNTIDTLTVGSTDFKHNTFGSSTSVFNTTTGLSLTFTDGATGGIVDNAWEYTAGSSTTSSVQLNAINIGDNITSIGDKAFFGNKLEIVTIGNGVTYVGEQSFAAMGIKELILGNSIETIGKEAFIDNEIPSFTFYDALNTIGEGAFKNNLIVNLALPNSVSRVESNAFENNKIETLSIGSLLSDENFGDDTFITNSISDLTVGHVGFRHDSLGDSKEVFDNLGFSLTFADTASGEIGERAWLYSTSDGDYLGVQIKNVTIGDSITNIGRYAFYQNDITKVVIGDGVKIIDDYAFVRTNVSELTLGNSVEEIRVAAFYDNNISQISLPSSLKSISNEAFKYNNITDLKLSDNLLSIGDEAFAGNGLLKLELPSGFNSSVMGSSVNVFANMELDSTNNHILKEGTLKELILGNTDFKHDSFGDSTNVFASTGFDLTYTNLAVGSISDSAWKFDITNHSSSKVNNLTFGTGITSVGASAFEGNGFAGELVLGDNVETIGASAFVGNKLTSLTAGTNLRTIGNNAFADNEIAGELVLNDLLETIGNEAFINNNLTGLKLGTNLTTIGASAFLGSSIAGEIDLPDSLVTIWASAFESNAITSIKFGTNLNTIGNNAFLDNSITGELAFNELLENIGTSAFSGNTITGDLVITNNVKTIGSSAFVGSTLSSLTLGSSLHTIGAYAFKGVGLTGKFTLHDTISSVGEEAFAGNTITELETGLKINKAALGENTFIGSEIAKLTVKNVDLMHSSFGPAISVFKTTGYDLTFATEAKGAIGERDWEYNYFGGEGKDTSYVKINNLVIGSGITSIGAYSLYGNAFDSVTMGENVTSIGNYSFCHTTTIGDFVIPDKVISIGAGAFHNSGLTTLVVGTGVKSIPDNAFGENNALTEVTFRGGSVINGSAFTSNPTFYNASGSIIK